MGLDQYKVDVLHYINPYLIWVVVHKEGEEDKFFFEQIGIYGIMPQNVTIGDDCVVKTESCSTWMPAAVIPMKKALREAAEVWFSPTYIDKKTSIFEDNIHKYGELTVILKDGKEVNILNEIVDTGFGFEDECLFHKELRDNQLDTRLEYLTVHEVIKQIEEGYKSRKIPKDIWLEVLKSQTFVLQEAKMIETSLASRKLHITDGRNMETVLKNKLNALKLCKDVDEDSAGIASTFRSSRPSSVVSVAMKKKLDWLRSQKIENRKVQTVDDSTKDKSDFDDQVDNPKPANKVLFEGDGNNNHETKLASSGKKQQWQPTEENFIAIGPAGLPLKKFSRMLKPQKEEDLQASVNKKVEERKPEIEVEEEKNPDVYANTDSEVNLKITNLDILKKIKAQNVLPNDEKCDSKTASQNSALTALRRKIKYLGEKKAKMNDSLSSISDKDSSKCDLESDAESLTALEEEFSRNRSKKVVNSEPEPENFDVEVNKWNVNPFRNLDGSISIFVDKLVSPVLMVHTKKNNRIQPVSNMRDIPFGDDIHMVLKNMGIEKPMRPQTVSWPTIMRGHSFFLIGPYNSGSTMGYLPAVCRLVSDYKNMPNNFGLSCIIVCATSHSVTNVETVCKMFLHRAKILACFAGMSDLDITTSLLNGCDILICTPTMLVRLIQDDFSLDLHNLSTFVVDDCERVSKVYTKELKFCLLKVMDIVKSRANKEWKVQYVIVSRVWCDFMATLARKAPDSVICISAFEECVPYTKVPTSVEFVKQETKVEAVINFLKDIDRSKMTVIVCRTDDEVKLLVNTLTKLKYVVFSCDSTMTVQDLYNLDKALKDYEEPVSGPVLVCLDGNLTHLNVTDAVYLIHYSLPSLYSMFCKRFAVLIDNYPSVFKDEKTKIKIKILLDDTNIEQLPKILHFIKRCTNNVSPVLNEISSTVLSEKNLKKAQNFVPICKKLLSLGKCPDFWNCMERHAIFKDYDTPKAWMPKEGTIIFQILHYHSAIYYSARITSCITKTNTVKYAQTYSLLSFKMGMYFSKEENRRLYGVPKVGDICAVTLKQNLFARCQIAKVLKTTNNRPTLLLVKLIDEERYEIARDTWLYCLPDELKGIETHVVTVILANLIPQDKDVTFSKLAEYQLKKITEEKEDLYMRGQITMVVGNVILVDTLEACQNLSSLEEVVVYCDFRKELLDNHAMQNPDHIKNLRKICDYACEEIKEEPIRIEEPNPIKILPKPRWAHLESGQFSSVFFVDAESPWKFFVRPVKFDSCLNTLVSDIKQYVNENPEPVENLNVGDIVIAELPGDATYERARIDSEVKNGKVKCFFVDQAESSDVSVNKILPITEKLITRLPFQAIECRLIGIQPFGDSWTDFSTNFFVDSCFDSLDKHKQLYTKYFTKEKAEFTEGHKYGVVLIDTYSTEDVIINQMLVDKNLAEENEEFELLHNLGFERKSEESSDSDSDDAPEQKNVSLVRPAITSPSSVYDKLNTMRATEQKNVALPPIRTVITSEVNNKPNSMKPSNNIIRSVPLVGSDDDSDEFELVSDDKGKLSSIPLAEVVGIKELPETEWNDNTLAAPIEETQKERTKDRTEIKLNNNPILKTENIKTDELSKPKLLWCQNNNTVTIKIKIIVDEYDLVIKERYIKFSADANDTKYGFDFELYGVVSLNKSCHSNKGQYILVKLWKVLASNWLSLTRDVAIKKWIAYDIENIEVTSDEESVILDDRKKMLPDQIDSDSDDNLEDDITFSY
ncbi:putative ATP-dependent RNA helicase TDRD12 [Helicoverpa zea]|uniref:putative ATP-dependent RNA helicase TDRD12 n=1 Tax=Helicoverpa zea TaxID=7113 RepID=UPI001F55DCB4|nr:putative ATP-dependent RNA helicase TDRD12 [Helicoverpa zea]